MNSRMLENLKDIAFLAELIDLYGADRTRLQTLNDLLKEKDAAAKEYQSELEVMINNNKDMKEVYNL